MYKILISGYYGFNNIGDEAILRTVTNSLRESIPGADITILSQDPADTEEKYGLHAVKRKSPIGILRAVAGCDILISGGGSLLQDVTSRISIFYYLAIIRLALLFGKKVFIYSQGIGPINSPYNRRMTRRVLSKVHGIVVRDELSARLLREIGLDDREIHITADPVIRMRRPERDTGAQLLSDEGVDVSPDRLTVGWAVRSVRGCPRFLDEIETSIRALDEMRGVRSVLIPFHYEQDLDTAIELERRLDGKAVCLRKKHLSEEMLSIIGHMDVLVGVRLHSLIYASVMGVPMIGISYDPKIDAFMRSVGLSPMAAAENFTCDRFLPVFKETLQHRDDMVRTVSEHLAELRKKLELNEQLVLEILAG